MIATLALSLVGGSIARAVTYPDPSFLYGNTAVNAVGQTSYVNGSGLPYRYLLPINFNPNTKYPAIIFLHGLGETGTDNKAQLAAGGNTANGALALVSNANQAAYPCFFIAPQTTSGITWSSDTAATDIQNLLTIFETQYPNAFDTTRIYLTGLSLGGMGTYDQSILMALPAHLGYNPFAALVPQSGNVTVSQGVSAVANVPIWVFHGANDGTVGISYSDDVNVPALRNRGSVVIYTRYNTGGHGVWPTAYAHPWLLPWMFAQKLGQPQQGVPGLTINTISQGTNLSMSGTSTSPSPYAFTRIGWTSNFINGIYQGSGTGNGTKTFTAATANFNSSNIGQRFEFSSSNLFFNILSVDSSNPHQITVDANVPSYTGNFATLPYGCYNNPYPMTGTLGSTWSLSGIPLSSGNNIIHIFGEAPTNGSLGGMTTINAPYLVAYTSHSGDTTPPTLAMTAPTNGTTYSTSVNPLTFSGTASDNVAITQMTCTNNGVAASAPSLVSGTWNVPGGVTLVSGPNIVSVTAKDAAGNLSTISLTVNYTPGSYSLWKTAKFGANASNPAIAGDTVDYDGDGIPNLMEYALNGDPTVASTTILPAVGQSSGALQFSFTRIAPTDVTYIVEASNDLVTWTPLATLASGGSSWTGSATVNETGTGSTRSVTVTDTTQISSVAHRYLRLRVTNP